MSIAIVNFRTLPNGSYKWVKRGQRRGYWRVLIVTDPTGPTNVNARNVEAVIWQSDEGIDGMTERSAYCLDTAYAAAKTIARRWNANRLGANIAAEALRQVSAP